MKIGIATDSTCDLPPYLVEQHDIEVIPSVMIIDGQEYVDGIDMTRQEFYKILPGLKSAPTTATSSTAQYSSAYESLFSRGYQQILSIHAPEALTTIVNTARQAARAFAGKITCIDSGSLSLGMGFQVLAAAEAAEHGLQAALEAMNSARHRVRVFAALDGLEYLKRSGRVPTAVAALGGLLSIKPIIELHESQVKPVAAVRTRRQADERMFHLLLGNGGLERLAVLHTGAEHRARNFLNELMHKASQAIPRDILMVNVTTVIGTHVGPNGLGFASVAAG